ncbi:MAG: hypothetical protein MSH60_05655 [Ruminococcus sp.]|nr:hypothetical protein [Ruminococcus sp.]
MLFPFQRAAVRCKAVRRNTMIALEQTAERNLPFSGNFRLSVYGGSPLQENTLSDV